MSIKQVVVAFGMMLFGPAVAQPQEIDSISLQSMEGSPIKVKLFFDNVNDKILFNLSSEQYCIDGYRGLEDDVKILNQKFIVLNFAIRGGTGHEVHRSVILSVAGGKFYKALDIISLENGQFKDTYNREIDARQLYDEKYSYRVKFLNYNENKHLLFASQFEKNISKYDPTTNRESLDTLRLEFDEEKKVFCTGYGKLQGNIKLTNENRFFKGENYPAIKLKNVEYFYIDEVWYIKIRETLFEKMSSECN